MSGLSIFPRLMQSSPKQRPERLLLLCYYSHRGIVTVPQNISFLQRVSNFEIDVYNFAGSASPFRLPANIDLGEYTGVVLHNSLAYNVDNLRELDANLAVQFKNYGGLKVIFKQDENHKSRETAKYLGEKKFDIVFTCLPESEREKVYPREVVGDITFSQMLTGYVTPDLRDGLLERFAGPRDIDVGYRGSLQPLNFGRLCYEKRSIGESFLKATADMSLKCDISSRWEDRFSGDDWFKFLCRSKAVLGVESGASIFDLDGEVALAIRQFNATCAVDENDPEYAERLLEHLKHFEGNVYYNQVSPRHFEAAATKTLQIMFEGRYSDILVPGKHFVELKRDFSNIREVIEVLRDEEARTAIIETAYRDIVVAPTYWIETFVAGFDDVLRRCIDRKTWAKPAVQLPALRGDRTNVLLLCAHHPDRDPRIGWIQRNAPKGMVVHVLGIESDLAEGISIAGDEESGLSMIVTRTKSASVSLGRILPDGADNVPGVAEATYLAWIASMRPDDVARVFGVPTAYRVAVAQSIADYFLNTAASVIDVGSRIQGIDAIIACDLEVLLPAAFLKHRLGVQVMYDAHEFWPDSDDASAAAEFELWQNLERRLLPYVDDAVTVTPGLAEIMSNFYGRPFGYLPNCEPRDILEKIANRKGDASRFALERQEGEVAFLVQGNFASGRGFDALINLWSHTDARAKLFLRGPDRPYKEELKLLAKQLNLLDTRVFFPAAVDEADLVPAAALADVGVIPYEPRSINNYHCGPNKLSQYMAAGVPVLSNRLQFVESILRAGDCGIVADLTSVPDFVGAVNALTEDIALRRRLGNNGRNYFASDYNWNAASGAFYQAVASMAGPQSVAGRVFLPSTVRAPQPVLQSGVTDTLTVGTVKAWGNRERTHGAAHEVLRFVWHVVPARVRRGIRHRARAALSRILAVL